MQLSDTPLPIRIISHNIRYATQSPFKGEELWSVRLPHFISQLKFLTSAAPHIPTVICLQEVLHNQLVDILTELNNNTPSELRWTSIGVHRNDGKNAGEASPIIYQPSVFTPLTNNTTWLSPTPTVPSKGWDAASIRIVTHGIFQHVPTKKKLVLMSTHLDDQGSESRYNAAGILIHIIAEYRGGAENGFPLPVALAGDFNSQEMQEAYKRMAADDSGVLDVRNYTDPSCMYGERNTFTGFEGKEEDQTRIDFIFVNDSVGGSSAESEKNKEWRVKGYTVMPNTFKDVGVYISDHRAVVADLEVL